MRKDTHSLVVTKISERGTSESRIARPTSCSFAGRLSRPIHVRCDQERTVSCGRVEVPVSDLNARELQSIPHDEHDAPGAPSRPSHTPARRHRAPRASTCPPFIRNFPAAILARRITYPRPTLGTRTPLLRAKYGMSTAMIFVGCLRTNWLVLGYIISPQTADASARHVGASSRPPAPPRFKSICHRTIGVLVAWQVHLSRMM
jgi:hypothetical protein